MAKPHKESGVARTLSINSMDGYRFEITYLLNHCLVVQHFMCHLQLQVEASSLNLWYLQ